MWFHSLLASWKSGLSRGRRPQPRPVRRGTRLVLEQLEDRSLPSSYSAASVSALIADIKAANTARGANTITLTAPTTSPYVLTATNAATGLPVIAANDNLTIVGNGDTIEGFRLDWRLLDVAYGASLTLQNLTLKGGDLGLYGPFAGGAIYNQGALTLSGVTVRGNRAAPMTGGSPGMGGGIWSSGSLTLENGTLVEDNVVGGGRGPYPVSAFGGAVYIAGGSANISNTTFTGNSATGGYSGVGPDGSGFGGALYVAAGQVVMTTSTVNNNTVYGYFNAGDAAYGGGVYVAGGKITLSNDTVQSNSVNETSAFGGGLYVAGGTVTLNNDTVGSNLAGSAGGGIYIFSGATVYIDPFTLANVINNTAAIDPNIDGTYIDT